MIDDYTHGKLIDDLAAARKEISQKQNTYIFEGPGEEDCNMFIVLATDKESAREKVSLLIAEKLKIAVGLGAYTGTLNRLTATMRSVDPLVCEGGSVYWIEGYAVGPGGETSVCVRCRD